jgi:hypothetical protein
VKPHGAHNEGLRLETVNEALTLGAALDFAVEAAAGDEAIGGYHGALNQIALVVRGKAETHQLVHGEDAGAPFSLVFPEQMGAGMVMSVLRGTVESHPDPTTRMAISDMLHSYETDILNSAMSETPPPEPEA